MECSICSEEIAGYGNNAEPVNEGRCCDQCNSTSVIPARLGIAIGNSTEDHIRRIEAAVERYSVEYLNTANDPAFALMASLPENRQHIVRIGASILCTRWEVGYPGGSFAQAVCNNNLSETFGRADSVNLNCIRFYVTLLYNQRYVD